MDTNTGKMIKSVTVDKAPLGIVVLMWACIICAICTVAYFMADYIAASSELSVVENQIKSIEMNR